MLPNQTYQEGRNKLEDLLGKLFEDNNRTTPEEVIVLKKKAYPSIVFSSCCSYTYGSYDG